jgi:DNA-binding protein YbaB
MFDKMKAVMEMQKKMQEIKRQLEMTVFDVESDDGMVKLTMNGSQEVKGVMFPRGLQGVAEAALGAALKDAFGKALKRSQAIAAQKMKEVTGLGIPGV